jgi:thioredoxin-like negative regulator of GroEL
LRLDGNSEFAAAFGAEIFLREGNPQAAMEALRKLPDNYSLGGELLVRSCLERRSPSEIAGIVRQVQVTAQSQPDPELMYSTAAFLAICGRREEAVQLLHQAIRGNYCSYPSLMTDPLLASVKDHPDFAAVVSDAKACREKFESYRRQHDAKTVH